MSLLVFHKLLAIFVTVALGWIAGRLRWLGEGTPGSDPARTLANAAFYIFVPALLFRTTARLDPAQMPWSSIVAFFVPVVAMLLLVYGVLRWRVGGQAPGDDLAANERAVAAPSTRAIAATFGNSLQVGVPLAAGLFGEKGLAIHIALISLHALILLSLLTALVEMDLARARARHEATAGLLKTLRATVRNTLIHPVVLPVLAGLAWNATDWPLPGPLDETLALLGTAVAPMCLVLIGLSLAYGGIGTQFKGAIAISLLKLIALPALVLAVAHWGFGLAGLPLQVVVMMAALPTGSNALIFAQRYRSQEAEATTTIVVSTFSFVFTAPLWLMVLGAIA
jgi:malonate transporter and related proteins